MSSEADRFIYRTFVANVPKIRGGRKEIYNDRMKEKARTEKLRNK
jgi:hypothetical protein